MSEIFPEDEYFDGGYSSLFLQKIIQKSRINSAPATIEFYEFLENFPFDFETKIKSPGIQSKNNLKKIKIGFMKIYVFFFLN